MRQSSIPRASFVRRVNLTLTLNAANQNCFAKQYIHEYTHKDLQIWNTRNPARHTPLHEFKPWKPLRRSNWRKEKKIHSMTSAVVLALGRRAIFVKSSTHESWLMNFKAQVLCPYVFLCIPYCSCLLLNVPFYCEIHDMCSLSSLLSSWHT